MKASAAAYRKALSNLLDALERQHGPNNSLSLNVRMAMQAARVLVPRNVSVDPGDRVK